MLQPHMSQATCGSHPCALHENQSQWPPADFFWRCIAQVEAQRRALGIEEYSLSQTTLEQVFVNLAQREAAAADQP